MAGRPVRTLDQPVDVTDGGRQVRPEPLVDQQLTNPHQPVTVDGWTFTPAVEFDRIFAHGARE